MIVSRSRVSYERFLSFTINVLMSVNATQSEYDDTTHLASGATCNERILWLMRPADSWRLRS